MTSDLQYIASDKTKAEIRKYIVAEKKRIGNEELVHRSSGVVELLENHPLFVSAHTVLLYYSLPGEVFTHQFLARHAQDKVILLPVVEGENLLLRRYSPEKMQKGAFGIMEPIGDNFTDFSSIDLAVIPGVAFDSQGHRLGRGRGFYDRLLPLLNCTKIGLCFPFQLLDSVPSEPHDIPMDEVLCG